VVGPVIHVVPFTQGYSCYLKNALGYYISLLPAGRQAFGAWKLEFVCDFVDGICDFNR